MRFLLRIWWSEDATTRPTFSEKFPLGLAEEMDVDMRNIVPLRCDTGRIVATFDTTTKTLLRSLVGSKHLLRSPRAICFDKSVITQALLLGGEKIRVRDTEDNTIYSVPFFDFLANCFVVNYGFGNQVGLTLNYWTSQGGKPWKATPPPVIQKAPEVVENFQMPLFY